MRSRVVVKFAVVEVVDAGFEVLQVVLSDVLAVLLGDINVELDEAVFQIGLHDFLDELAVGEADPVKAVEH